MRGDEARVVLGFPPNSRPSPSQVKAAYKKKVWESHPDLFPLRDKPLAESKFKLISEAYGQLLSAWNLTSEGVYVDFRCGKCFRFGEMAPLRSMGYVDPGWEHGVAQDEKKKKVKCNYCGKVVSGGIFRLKQHLARISGEVTHCDDVPEEVCLDMRQNLEGCRSARKRRQYEYEQMPSIHSNEFNGLEDVPGSYKHKGKKVVDEKNLVIRFAPLRSLGYVDPGWEHCVAQDEKKKRVKCNYCEKVISGGINRFKQHLARIPGEVACCDKAPEEVYLKMKENMKWHRSGRRNRKPDGNEISAFYMHSDDDDDDDNDEQDGGFLHFRSKDVLTVDEKYSDDDIRDICKARSAGSSADSVEPPLKRSRLDSVFLKSLKSQSSSHYKQVKTKTAFERKAWKEVASSICRFFYHTGIPSSAVNSPYFQKMLEAVGQYGQIPQVPSGRLIAGRFLQDEIVSIKESLVELKASWSTTGCSVLADSWNDLQGRTIINFLASCPRGLYFVSSHDATDIVGDAASLFKMFDKVVEEVGEEYVVQVISKASPSFKAAGKMLEEKRTNIFWTPCAVHCIDQMLEDFLSIKWVGECIVKAKMLTRLVYNSVWLLTLMKKEFTNGEELLKPAMTKFATTFFTLQTLLDHRIGLKRMFLSDKWVSSRISNSDFGKEVEQIVLNSTFWKKLQHVKRSLEPVAHVLQRLDSDEERSIPFIYNEISRAKMAIRAIHGDDKRKYGPFWFVIDNHWNALLHHPLHVAAYFLNPSYRYRHEFMMHPEVIRGLNECIVRLEHDSGKRISASMQIPDFVSAKADFGTDLAVSTRQELDPAAWWQQHGINCLELQRIAIRILSQTCSSVGCEHTWSTYDQVHGKRNNCLSRKRWNELAYVHYNLRLREHQVGRKPKNLVSFDNSMVESILDTWLVEAGKQAVLEDEEINYHEAEQYFGDQMDDNYIEERRPGGMVHLTTGVEHLEFDPATGLTTDDESLDFLDDDLTD